MAMRRLPMPTKHPLRFGRTGIARSGGTACKPRNALLFSYALPAACAQPDMRRKSAAINRRYGASGMG
jgi:hypothetical protein